MITSLKGCWDKFSNRVRDCIESVDSYHRPAEDVLDSSNLQSGTLLKQRQHNCDRLAAKGRKRHDKSTSHHKHHDHNRLLPFGVIASGETHHFPSHNHHHHKHTVHESSERHQQASLSPRAQLPPGYSRRKTSDGQIFFVDSEGRKYWYDPSVPKELLAASLKLNLDALVGRLSANWEIRQSPSGKTYYVDHVKRSTQFTDPRLVIYRDQLMCYLSQQANDHQRQQQLPYSSQQSAKNNRDLFDKISILRQELLKQQVLTHPCRIYISRKRIFEESFRVISHMSSRDLKKRLLVKFKGEEGLDYGGVAREWFYQLSRKMLNPMSGLFQYTSDDIYNLQINPDSGIVYREHLSYFNFCGSILGMAVFHGHFIEGHFTKPFYKMLLRKPITLRDIEHVDPELYSSLCWILDNDITEHDIDTTFLVQHNALGQLQEYELKENGRNIAVTEENKSEYVDLYVNYRCRRGIEYQFEALQRGFNELISGPLLENFDEDELVLLIGGLSKIDVEDWKSHTKLKNCSIESPIIVWFWNIVKSYNEERRAKLLQFVTGSPRVPIQGFKALQGVNSELRLFTIHVLKNAPTDNLPKSHTCFNRIDLPPYETFEKLRDKLTQAIEETMGFAMQ